MTGLQESGGKLERLFRAKSPLAWPGQCSAALLGTQQSGQVLAAVSTRLRHCSGFGEQLEAISAHSPLTWLFSQKKVYYCIPQREKHFAWYSATQGCEGPLRLKVDLVSTRNAVFSIRGEGALSTRAGGWQAAERYWSPANCMVGCQGVNRRR